MIWLLGAVQSSTAALCVTGEGAGATGGLGADGAVGGASAGDGASVELGAGGAGELTDPLCGDGANVVGFEAAEPPPPQAFNSALDESRARKTFPRIKAMA